MDSIFSVDVWVGLVTLTALEIVLSVDNLVVNAILVGKLPSDRQRVVPRLLLLLVIG